MNETIYNLVPREYVIPEKPPMHKSKHNPQQNLTGSTFGCHGSTRLPGAGLVVKKEASLFGPKEHTNTGYLKKKTVELPPPETVERSSKYSSVKPAVVKASDRPVMGIRTTKNFITANAVEAILAAPRVPPSSKSDYKNKDDYGKVPEYLVKVKEEIRRENEMIDRYIKDRMGVQERDPEHLEEMPEHERQELIAQLKAKWDSVNASYQRMTHMTRLDTCGKMKRKEGCEQSLKELEANIEKLSRPGPIYIKGL